MTNHTTHRVHASTVPTCLRHGSETDPLYDAQALSEFLATVAEIMHSTECRLTDKGQHGHELCFKLMTDKIAIGSGKLPFPLVGYIDHTLPVLWTPNETPGGEHE